MASERKERYGFLDGLRGWASLAVVFWHVFIEVYPISPGSANILKLLPPSNGIFAVNLFFVISGFALSIAYVKRHDFKLLARIAASRYLRLAIPIFAACMLVHFAMTSGIIPPVELRAGPHKRFLLFDSTFVHLVTFSLFDVFFRFSFDQTYIPPLWTMPIELKGSMITLVLLAVLGRHKRSLWICGTALFFVLVFRNSSYCLFVAGMIMASIYVSRDFSGMHYQVLLWGGFLLGLLTPFLTNNQKSPFYLTAIIIFFGSALWIVPIRQFFENRTSHFLGRISFPLYLLHGPVLWTFSLWFKTMLAPFALANGTINFVVGFVTVFVSIGAAIAFSPVNDFAIYVSRGFGVWLVSSIEFGLKRIMNLVLPR